MRLDARVIVGAATHTLLSVALIASVPQANGWTAGMDEEHQRGDAALTLMAAQAPLRRPAGFLAQRPMADMTLSIGHLQSSSTR